MAEARIDPALLRAGPVVVVGMAPLWGMPSPSPFCTKLETWLRMAGIPYTAKVLQGPPRSATGKIPYLELPDGSTLADSGRIIEALTEARGVRLDDHLSARDRSAVGALTVEGGLISDLRGVPLSAPGRALVHDAPRLSALSLYGASPGSLIQVERAPLLTSLLLDAPEVAGLALSGTGLADLSGLSTLRQIHGDLILVGNPSLPQAEIDAFLAGVRVDGDTSVRENGP